VGGFDRNVLAAAGALLKFRKAWEEDPENEEKALSLAGTYRAIGKPTTALEVHKQMLSRHPGRDWVHHLRSAQILLDGNAAEEAAREIEKGFAAGELVSLDNGEEYRILSARVRIEDIGPRFSIEAVSTRTGNSALIVSCRAALPGRSISRLSGDFAFPYAESEGLIVYDQKDRTPDRGTGSLSSAVLELTRLCWSEADFNLRACTLPVSPWTAPVWAGGALIRETEVEGHSLRLVSYPGKMWRVECRSDTSPVIGWNGSDAPGSGELFVSRDGDTLRIPVPEDPFVHLAFDESVKTLYLVLGSDLPGKLGDEGVPHVCILTPEEYRHTVLSPCIDAVHPRLDRLFRFSRTLSADSGVGDVIYTIQPDSRITLSLLTGIDGMGAASSDLSPGGENGVKDDTTGIDPLRRRTVIPFSQLDAAEDRQDKAFSPDTQAWLQEVRSYVAAALFNRTHPRDPAYEAKARAILSGYASLAEPVQNAILRPGDILVRNDASPESGNRPRSVFIVRFLQGKTGVAADGPAVVRGFWVAEQEPVATERLDTLTANFSRVIVAGDDTHHHTVRRLAADFHPSLHPWQFFRTGSRYDPVDRFEFSGLELEYRPMNRRFRLAIRGGSTDAFSIEETGYPVGTTVIAAGNREPTRWPGDAIADIRYLPENNRVRIVLADELLTSLLDTRTIGNEPIMGSGGVMFEFTGTGGDCRPESQR